MKYPIGTNLVENTFKGWTSGFPVCRVIDKDDDLVYLLQDSSGSRSRWTEQAIDNEFHVLSDHNATRTKTDNIRVTEPVSHPLATQVGGSHYKNLAIQPAEFVMANNIPWAEGNAIKYIVRHKSKNGKEDLEKAKHYIDMIIAREYPEQK